MDEVKKIPKQKSREYPAVTLSDAIIFIEKLKEFPQNKPISYESAASVCGVKCTTNSFKYTLSAARQYGLISTAAGQTLTLLDSAKEFIRPTKNTEELRLLKIKCFQEPKLYAELIQEYQNNSLPTQRILENVLINQYSILPGVAPVAAATFLSNANEIGVVQSGILDITSSIGVVDISKSEENSSENNVSLEENVQIPSADINLEISEFAAPLNIPFGDKRRAVLYMPLEVTKEDAEYVKDMISLMLKRVYKVE